jgi:hypothetical protein
VTARVVVRADGDDDVRKRRRARIDRGGTFVKFVAGVKIHHLAD